MRMTRRIIGGWSQALAPTMRDATPFIADAADSTQHPSGRKRRMPGATTANGSYACGLVAPRRSLRAGEMKGACASMEH